MKNYIYILCATLAIIFISCKDDYLDVVPDNIATLDNAFSNRYNAQKFLYTLYMGIPSPGSVKNPALNGADEIWYPKKSAYRAGTQIAKGFQSVVNSQYNKWQERGQSGLYVGIRNCNIFLSRIGKVQGLDEYEKKQWIAEAKFLKAYFHFYLFRMYGPIVNNKELVPVTESTHNVKAVRNTTDETIDYILLLLDESIKDLPLILQFEDQDLGRITKPIAAAIKARVLITYASPLFNGNSVYSGFTNKNGESFFPKEYDASKWEKAATATKIAIDLCHDAGFRLHLKSDYTNAFPQSDQTMLKSALRGRITEKWNSELIWGQTSNTASIEYESMPRLYSYTTNPVFSRHCPPMRIAEMYYSKNGVPINEDINYDYTNRFKLKTASQEDKYYIEEGQKTAILNFEREPRFYADLAFDRSVWFGNGKEKSDKDPWYIHARKGEFASVFSTTSYSATGYWPKKLVSMKTLVQNGTKFTSKRFAFPIVRLADLYLYYAEALNESKGSPDNEVYEYIDLVRERGGLKSVVSSWGKYSKNPSKPSTKQGMREIIQRERMIEMSFEGTRFWDLRRWKLAKKHMNKPIKGWNILEKDINEYYTVKVLYNPTFSEKDYLWPIPEGEIIKNPSLIQNPGW